MESHLKSTYYSIVKISNLQTNMLVGEADSSLIKTITRMLRGMLARELSVQWLGSGRRRTKLQFNTTRACEVIHCEFIEYYLNGFLNNKLSVNVYI